MRVLCRLLHRAEPFALRWAASDQRLPPANGRLAQALGVEQMALPHKGRRMPAQETPEQQRWFKQGQRFQSNIEGRISVVKRTALERRGPSQGWDSFERWVG